MAASKIEARMAVVEDRVSQLIPKVDSVQDGVNEIKLLLAGRPTKDKKHPVLNVDRLRDALILGAILGGVWYAKPTHSELKAVIHEAVAGAEAK